jgi:hypothetical protein
MEDAAATPKTAPISYDAPMLFNFGPGWRRPRSVAISDNLLAMVERDGTARSLRFVPDPKDSSRASIVYTTGENPEFTLLAGQVGPVWATFDNTAARFRRKGFPNREGRWMTAVAILTGIFLVLAGTWSVMAAKPRIVVHIESDISDAPTQKWPL